MGRGSTQLLIRKVVESLSKSPKTITELADETGMDRTAISRYVNILIKSGLLIEDQDGTNKKLILTPSYRLDTYFGLPLEQMAEKQLRSIYHLIRKNWTAITTKKLLSTHAQKIAYEVITTCDDLKIPVGWYIYGGISALVYDDSAQYDYYKLPIKIESCIREVTAKYSKNEYAWQSKKLQYEEKYKELYVTKEEILSILYSGDFDKHPKNSLYVSLKKIRKLISSAPKESDPDYPELLGAYQDLMLDISTKLDETTILSRKRQIILLFEAVWKYIALFNFKQELGKFYSEKILNLHFHLDIKQQEDDIVELGAELQSQIPEDDIKDSIKKKLHEALSQIKSLNLDEQKKQKEEMNAMREKLGEEKFQKWLLQEVGLK
jgi:hypothetical protein